MIIKCKATKRFLLEVEIEKYIKNIRSLGIEIQTPLLIKIPCGTCKMIEEYEVYENEYIHTKSYKNTIDNH